MSGALLCTSNIVVIKTQRWLPMTLESSEITSMQVLLIPLIHRFIKSHMPLEQVLYVRLLSSFLLLLYSRKREKPHLIILFKTLVSIACGKVGALGDLCGRWY